ncbi:hypothetical protein RAC89_14580 [Paenibacillus sp. GD4]|uniref:hypothetical protein n=1 Tax=Paenibacillus sp. GD4 TaxID=3068890 RepID=UPI00279662DC|nr:hypothetical protein [Paenibacillus sp. GD4]MDQ1911634.1 hypothetical protein [Paenibacillus sp. GD4]
MTHLSKDYNVIYLENTGFRNPKVKDWKRIISIFKKNNKYVNPKPSNLVVVKPVIFPPNGIIFRLLNKYIFIPLLIRKIKSLGFNERDIAFIYLPSFTSIELLRQLSPSKVIFDCVANFSDHNEKPKDYDRIISQLMKIVDTVITDSNLLYTQYNNMHHNVHQLHQGVNTEKFKYQEPYINEFRSICFFGAIDDRIDWGYMDILEQNGVKVDLIGAVKSANIPNRYTIKGPFKQDELFCEINKYDAFIIPYKLSSFADGIIPAKIFECLAIGKPLLASRLPSLEPYNDVIYLCETPEDFKNAFNNLKNTENEEKRKRRRLIAEMNSVNNSLSHLDDIITRCYK